jgi:uncharacterized membrane protein (DUF4010 family)
MDDLAAWLDPQIAGIAVALGLGLLIGLERERSKGAGPSRAAAGIRTFTLVALLGALAAILDRPLLMAVLAAAIALLAAVSHFKATGDDPGLTLEVALLVTFALGLLAPARPLLAAGLGALVALLLASRGTLHEFVRNRLTDREVLDAILLAATVLLVVPLLPDRPIDPYGAVNLQLIGRLTVIVLLINATGYLAVRTLGTHRGLVLAGFFGGFVSSVATIAAMGDRARKHPEQRHAAIAAAALSSVATVVQLAVLLAVVAPAVLLELSVPLAVAGAAAIAYGGFYTYRAAWTDEPAQAMAGRAFRPRQALAFALTVTLVLGLSALLASEYGSAGASAGIAVAGFADVHAAGVSAAGLAATAGIGNVVAAALVLLAFTTNSLTKAFVAALSGGWSYFRAVVPGLALMLGAAWALLGRQLY